MVLSLNSRDLYLVFVLIQLSSLKYFSDSQPRTLPRQRDSDSGSPKPTLPSGPECWGGGKGLHFLVPPKPYPPRKPAVSAHNLLMGGPGLQHPSPRQRLANTDKFLPFPWAGLGGGLTSWESAVRACPLSFAMQTEKINLPASSDIWAELQAGSGDKARAKEGTGTAEPGCWHRPLSVQITLPSWSHA